MFPRIFIIAHFFGFVKAFAQNIHGRGIGEAASGTTAHSLPPNGGEGSDSISGQKRERAPVWGCAFSLEQMTGNFAFLQISNILCINADFRHYILNICAITGLLCHILWVRFG